MIFMISMYIELDSRAHRPPEYMRHTKYKET
jgi:hypothetical protein